MTALPAVVLRPRGRPRTVTAPGEVRGWYRLIRDLPDSPRGRRLLVRCLACERDVALSWDGWLDARRRTREEAPEVCRHQQLMGERAVLADIAITRTTTADRVRSVLEDLADTVDADARVKREADVLRMRARALREAGDPYGARALDACARLLEYAARSPAALRLVAGGD